ncbi:MAG: ECF transporter S component [Eggerthellaceae bacterium]|nr:ECF transporter S component [Eggerthellaceae bacterium]
MSNYAQNQDATVRKQEAAIQNTNRWSTKQLVTMALMCAIAILLSFIEFPIFPAASFLKLDISFVPSAVMGFAYGSGPGVLVGVACAVAHGAITGNWVGCLMNIIACCAFVIPASIIYKRNRTFKGAMIGLVVSIVCLVVAAIIANLAIDPTFYGIPFDVVAGLIVPAILPFNIIKGVVISVLTAIVYKSISNLITPTKDQVKGR